MVTMLRVGREVIEKAIDATMAEIERRHGPGAVLRWGERGRAPVEVIPTGSLAVDAALGIGGLPQGRVVEIYGPEASGKTTLALQAIAAAHRMGGVAAFIDAEHALDGEYARRLGVNVDGLLLSQPDCGEQALEITAALVNSGVLDVAVVDSVAALVPRAELEGEMGDSHMGLQARLMSQALRKLTGLVARKGTCLIFINQVREKIGVMFGNPETTTGGRALKFYASVRMEVRRLGMVKRGDEPVGARVRVKVVKNKLAGPFREAEIELLYGRGVWREAELVELGARHGLVEKSGTWYSFGGRRLGQGRERAAEHLEKHPETAAALEAKLRQKLELPAPRRKAENDDAEPAAKKTATGKQ